MFPQEEQSGDNFYFDALGSNDSRGDYVCFKQHQFNAGNYYIDPGFGGNQVLYEVDLAAQDQQTEELLLNHLQTEDTEGYFGK